jgi:hypothetical protein
MFVFGKDPEIENKDKSYELTYWRKRPSVHEWFRELGVRKGIEGCDNPDEFNGVKVPIEECDVKDFVNDIINKNMNYDVEGFFFGSDAELDDDEYEEYLKENLEAAALMLGALTRGHSLYYDSWW